MASPYAEPTREVDAEGRDILITDSDQQFLADYYDKQQVEQYTPAALETLASQGIENPTEQQIADVVRDLRVADAARSAARTDTAQPELFSLEGDRTRQPEEERAQREARDREGLRAAAARDEAAFEQPDLFALQQEQERRRLGPEELRRADQFMDVPEAAEVRQPAPRETQVDIEEAIAKSPVPEIRPADFQTDPEGVTTARTEVPFVPEGRERKPRRSATETRDVPRLTGPEPTPQPTPEPTPEPTPDPVPVTKEMLDQLGVQPKAPLRKRIMGKDLNSDDVRKQLGAYSRNKNIQEKFPETSQKITNLLEGTRDEQTDTPRSDIRDDEPTTALPRDDAERDRVSPVLARQPRVGGADTARAGAPAQRGLGDVGTGPVRPTRRTGDQPTALGTTSLTPLVTPEVVSSPVRPVPEAVAPTPVEARDAIPEVVEAEKPTPRPTVREKAATPKRAAAKKAETKVTRRKELRDVARRLGMTITPAQARDIEEQRRTKDLTDEQLEAQVFREGDERETARLEKEFDEVVTPPKKRAAKKAAPKRAARKKAAPKKVSAKKKKEIEEEVIKTIDAELDEISSDQREGVKFYTEKFGEAPKAEFITEDGDTEFVSLDVNTTESDDVKILSLIKTNIPAQQSKEKATETPERAEARSAQMYFRKQQNPNDAIEVIAHEVVFSDKNVPEKLRIKDFQATEDTSAGEREYFAGTGKDASRRALKWIRDNLSAETNKAVNSIIRYHQAALSDVTRKLNTKLDSVKTSRKQEADRRLKEELMDKEVEQERRAKAEAEFFEYTQDDLDVLPDYLREDAVAGLDIPTHPVIGSLLRQGKLAEALRALQVTSPSPRVTQLARALSGVAGNTKVEVKQFVTDEAGNPVAGKFDPKTNTITLNADTGINAHTILHEMTHAATSATLANKSHPLTKQLNKLFNDVKDSLDTAYGSQNVDEFVAEAFGNPEFQRKLAGINVKGEPINALQRFLNSVGNALRVMMGMKTKPVNSALNQADQLINAMLSPAPDSRFAGEMYMMHNVMDTIKNIGSRRSVPTTKSDKVTFIERLKDVLDGRGAAKAKEVLLLSLPIQAVVDLSVKYKMGAPAAKLQREIEKQIGDTNKADERVDATMKKLEGWFKANPTLKEAFDRVVYRSTIEHVDPSQPRSKYTDPEQLKAWDDMQADWRSLSATGGDKIYAEMRDAYKKTFEELKAVIGGQIDDIIEDPAERRKLRESVYEKMFEGKTIEPYFPLTRKGDLWLRYDAFNERTQTTEPVYEAFETHQRRRDRIKELEGDPRVRSKPKEYANINSITFGDAPSGSFMRDALDILKANQPKNPTKEEQDRYDEQREQLMRLFIQSLPETSFAKSMQKRQGYEGYNTDAMEAFRTKAYDLSRQVQRLKYSNRIRAVENELRAAWKASGSGEQGQAVLDELLKRASFARNPPNDLTNQLAAQANRFAFLGTIGFNVSSAVVNLSQVPLIMVPLLTGRYRSKLGINAPTAALGRAASLVTGSGSNRKIQTIDGENIDARGMPSIDNYYETDANGDLVIRSDLELSDKKRKALERYKPVVKMAGERGLLNRSLFYDTLGIDRVGRDRGLWETTNAASAFVFHTAERFNRQVALLSAFDLELQRMEKDGETINDATLKKAADYALYQTTEMNGGAALATAPRISQQGIGRVAMMYKSYGIQMYYTLFKTADRAVRRMENAKYPPEVVKAAREQMFGVIISSGLLAGVQGMPLVGGILMLANMFYDDDELDAETRLRQQIGEGFYKGPLNMLVGSDVASRIGLSNLLYRENPYSQSGSAADRAMELLGGPAWSVATQFGRGIKEVTSPDGNFERGVEAMMPAAIRNAYKGMYRYPRDEAILTRRGDPIHDDITTGGLVAQVLGFAPTDYTLKQEQNQQIKRIERSVGERRTKLLRRYYVAYRFGDSDGVRSALLDMQKFSRKHPSVAITPDTIQRSMAQHARTSVTMHNGITINPKMRAVLKDHVDNYWGSSFGFAGD